MDFDKCCQYVEVLLLEMEEVVVMGEKMGYFVKNLIFVMVMDIFLDSKDNIKVDNSDIEFQIQFVFEMLKDGYYVFYMF